MPDDVRSRDISSLIGSEHRWERLREVFEKLRIYLENPRLRCQGAADLVEQLETRLSEAARLFPEPDWMGLAEGHGDAGREANRAGVVGASITVLLLAVEALREELRHDARGEDGHVPPSGDGGGER